MSKILIAVKSVVNADLEIECFLVITGLKHTCYLSFDLAILPLPLPAADNLSTQPAVPHVQVGS